jgi:hypothetical protein
MGTERKRASLYLLLIFLCGAVSGAVATNLWLYWRPRSASANADVAPYSAQRSVEKFTKELDLTPDQAKQLNDILDETHRSYREKEAEMETIRQMGRTRIRGMLHDDQRPKYEDILARLDRNRRKRHP